jgi:hypothetical protein
MQALFSLPRKSTPPQLLHPKQGPFDQGLRGTAKSGVPVLHVTSASTGVRKLAVTVNSVERRYHPSHTPNSGGL